jgi:hypothetical protein
MNRWLLIVATVAAAAAGCNNPTCGAGTKQVQNKDGTIQCMPADALPDSIPCDVDGGASIVGGHCISAISCGPNTMLVNGQCVGTGGGGGVPPCPAPAAGTFCVNGALVNFLDSMPSTDSVDVAVFDPVTLLQGGAPIDHGVFTGGFVLNNLAPPTLGLLAVVVGDVDGNRMDTIFINCGVGDQGIQAGNKYRVDAYVLKKTVADAWGFDYTTNGSYVAKYYSSAKPSQNDLEVANDKTTDLVTGVVLVKDGAMNPAGTKYFNATLTAIDNALNATGASGAAEVPAPVSGSFPNFSGSGGGITWETQPGGSAKGLVFVTRFHKM